MPPTYIVTSGKGGVGKTTVAVQLAHRLAGAGSPVGLLDADVHGPSVAVMVGLREPPQVVDGAMQPTDIGGGVKALSVGQLAGPDHPFLWRGAFVEGVVRQLVVDTDWSGCGLLLIDTPPGTGDVLHVLSETADLAGAIVVTAPGVADVADSHRAVSALERLGLPVIAVVENVRSARCPGCGQEVTLEGADHAGIAALVARCQAPLVRLAYDPRLDSPVPGTLATATATPLDAVCDLLLAEAAGR